MTDISPTKHAKIHGYVESLSPIKNNLAGTRKYFTGKITDGSISRRLVGFDPKIHQALTTFKGKKQPVSVSNCEIKESSFSPELEILVRKSSDLQSHHLNLKLICPN